MVDKYPPVLRASKLCFLKNMLEWLKVEKVEVVKSDLRCNYKQQSFKFVRFFEMKLELKIKWYCNRNNVRKI